MANVLLAVFFFFLIPYHSYAYLDPGTGSALIQVFIATCLGASFYAKMHFAKIKSFISNLINRKKGN
jgi:hypothetical protein